MSDSLSAQLNRLGFALEREANSTSGDGNGDASGGARGGSNGALNGGASGGPNAEGTRLVLRDLSDPKLHPLAVDFLEPQKIHRLKYGLGKGQPLPRALGLKSLRPEGAPYVFDATAGLGTDAFFMAAMGCRVHAVERSPVVYALLEDGYERLAQCEEMAEIAARLTIECGHAAELLRALAEDERPDVIYLDPMYPEEGRSESALPKKPMQMFRRLIGDDHDSAELFDAARAVARERVVVKRPLRAPAIAEKPTHVFEGKTARYDMYLCR